MSIDAAIGRIDQIVGLQQQLMDPTGASTGTSATGGAAVASANSAATTATAGATGVGASYGTENTDATSSTDFANALAAATQATDATGLDSSTATSTPSLGESNDSSLLSLLSSLGSSSDATATADPTAADPTMADEPEALEASALNTGDTSATALPDTSALDLPQTGGASLLPATATVAPATSPSDPRISAMTQEADSLLGKPYVFGGGHDGWGPQSGYDCSGFVSAVLHAGGYLSSPQDTTSLPSAAGIESGPGQYVTIYDRAQPGEEGHVIIDIGGQFYESGGESGSWGGGGGVEKIGTPSASYLATFGDVLHPAGL